MGNPADTDRMGKFSFVSHRPPSFIDYPSRRKEENQELLQEGLRAQFYEHYRKEAEEYDKEFMKKHDEDLNTTLIFVGYAHYSGSRVLTWVSGRSVLCCHFRLHHPGPPPAPARLNRRDRRPPASHALQDG